MTIYYGKLLHDFDILTSGFFVKASVPLILLLYSDVEVVYFLVKRLLQGVKTAFDSLLDNGEISLPGSVWIVFTFQFLLNDEKARSEIIWVDWVID